MDQTTNILISQNQISSSPLSWHHIVLADLEMRLSSDSGFPCVFSKNAFKKQLIKFVFVENICSDGIAHLIAGLTEYVSISKDWNGSLDTAYPLLVAFSKSAVSAATVEEYHRIGWKILQQLYDADPAAWPEHVSNDPNSAGWSMCFNAMPLFINMSSPRHLVRNSRNLGDHFILVINPRERFDVFAGDTTGGRKVRANIRSRIASFDGVSHAVQLGTYNAGSLEWWQYGLVEDNVERSDRCPFIPRAGPNRMG